MEIHSERADPTNGLQLQLQKLDQRQTREERAHLSHQSLQPLSAWLP